MKHVRREKSIAHMQLVRIVRERRLSENISFYGRIILKLMLKEKGVRAYTEVIWLRVWAVVGNSKHGNETWSSTKRSDFLVWLIKVGYPQDSIRSGATTVC